MTNTTAPIPSAITYHQQTRELELTYNDLIAETQATTEPSTNSPSNQSFRLSAEFLRVHSPSAEVRGHGKDQEVLQTGKKFVKVENIQTVGNYALQLFFDDGHDSGIYSWRYLIELCLHQQQKWQDYLQALHQAGTSREPEAQVLHFQPPAK